MSHWPTETRPGTVPPGLHTALARARRDVLVITTMGTTPGRRGIPFLFDRESLPAGVRYRILVPEAVRLAGPVTTRLADLADAGAQVRTVPDVPLDALVVDGSPAVLPGGTPAGAVLTRVFDSLWSAGTPFGMGVLNTREHQVLTMLSAGRTDESMAAQLGLSVRTVRRMISALMGRLEARSRFQAGVRAANLGWPTTVSRRPSA